MIIIIDENSKFMALPKVSHFDPRYKAETECEYCHLPAHQEVMMSEHYCVFCTREIQIIKTESSISRFALPSLFLGITIYFVKSLQQFSFLLPFLLLIIFFHMIAGMSFVRLQIYRGFDPKITINHSLKFYQKNKDRPNVNEKMYFNRVMTLLKSDMAMESDFKRILLYYLVEYIMLDNSQRDSDYLEVWSKGLGLSIHDMIKEMFESTNITDGLGFAKGRNLLPEIWEYLTVSDDLVELTLDFVTKEIDELDIANESQRQMFLEDLYLIDEDLLEKVEGVKKWEPIKDALENFEPETPPKSLFEQLQSQANENQRLIEARRQAARRELPQSENENEL